MPSPDYVGSIDGLEQPHTPTEIIGRGQESRKSKTFLKNAQVANILGRIRGHPRMLLEVLRRLHKHHHTVAVEVEKDGEVVVEHVPEELTDAEIRDHYPIVRTWELLHQEQVDHYASVDGFTVRAAAGLREDGGKGQGDSSAGADRKASGQAGNREQTSRWE